MANITATSSANESFLTHLFDPRGRTNRAKFWLATLLYLLMYAVAFALFYLLAQQGMNVQAIGIQAITLVVGTVSSILIGIRRLHDRDKSGHWLWLFILVPGILSGVGAAISMTNPQAQAIDLLLEVASFAISIWALVELGFLRGTTGPNRFGPDPLQA